MNEQLQQALSDLINRSLTGLDKAGDFLNAEIPAVIQQLLLWHGVYEFIMFLIGVAFIVGVVYGNYRHFKWLRANWEQVDGDPVLIFHIFQIGWIPLICYFINLQWLQIWIAPKVWLLEYAAQFVKG